MVDKPVSAYKKPYKLRTVGKKETSYEVSFPPEVIERKARELGLTPGEFIEQYRAVAYYNAFDGVFYKFESIEAKEVLLPEILGETGKQSQDESE